MTQMLHQMESIKTTLPAQFGQDATRRPTPVTCLRPVIDPPWMLDTPQIPIPKARWLWLREQCACARVPRLQHCKCSLKHGAQSNQPKPSGRDLMLIRAPTLPVGNCAFVVQYRQDIPTTGEPFLRLDSNAGRRPHMPKLGIARPICTSGRRQRVKRRMA
jgi:hypothetical protein